MLLAGCSGSGHGSGAKATTSATSSTRAPVGAGADGTNGTPFRVDTARQPKTRSQALELLRAVTAAPDSFGPGYVRRTPYESDPADWPMLGTDCVWQQQALPRDVLGSLSRYGRLAATDGKGEIHSAATVTVHRTSNQAEWEIAETLEEPLRCPDQQLRDTERISHLNSVGSGAGTNDNVSADDVVMELGNYFNPTLAEGALNSAWYQVRLGPVTMAVAVEGGKGHQGRTCGVRRRAAAGAEHVRGTEPVPEHPFLRTRSPTAQHGRDEAGVPVGRDERGGTHRSPDGPKRR
ncbi:hypothetical protein A6P39_45535 [Streptomyces sp. FXJ1.172]|uniref:hypothetical protein n=1 Tax=Streptomyces sp. FXJ1.172 TaxID=710705 RepID=UPI002F3E5E86